MSARKEQIDMPEDFPFHMFQTKGVTDTSPTLHYHDCLEIDFVEEGSGVNLIEGRAYDMKPGDLYVINNEEHHMSYSNGSLRMLVIVFDPSLVYPEQSQAFAYLKPFFARQVNFSNHINATQPIYDRLRELVNLLRCEWQQKQEGYQLVVRAVLLQLLALLYRHFKMENTISDEMHQFRQGYEKIRPAVDYITSHYVEPISLQQLADIAHMNRTYFSGQFKKIMQIGLTEYIENIRMNKASLLLRSTELSISDIAYQSGFSSLSYFNRVFSAHFGMSPSQYRKKQNIFQKNTNK